MRSALWRKVALPGLCGIAIWMASLTPLAAQSAADPASLARQITQLHNAGRYADALPLAERMVALVKARHPETSLEYADALQLLAANYFFQSRYTEAEPIYGQALAIREKALGPSDESVLGLLDTLASIYRFSRRPELGEPLLQRILAERERMAGPGHPSVATTLRSLAEIQSAMQKYADAELNIRRALALSENASLNPTEIAQVLGALAQIELNQGRGTDAERTFQRALTLHEQAAKSGQTALEARIAHMYTLLQLAGLYQLSNRFNEAAAVAERLLAIAEGLFGPDHPNVATQLEAVAAMYAFQDRFADAEAARKRALAINERAYGNEHPSVAGSLQGLGHLYRLQDRNEEALPLLLRGLSIAEKTLGADDPGLIVYLSEIANLYGGQRRYADAELHLKRALSILDKTSGLDRTVAGVQNVQLMQSLAFLYQSQGRHQEGRPWIDRALAISEQMFGPDHIMTTTMVTSLAMQLLDQDQTDEAERLFERTLPANERSGQDSTAYADNLAGLGMVHFTRKDWGKAYAALERASAIQIAVEKRGAGTGTARRGQQPRVIRQAEMFLLQAVTAFRLTEADPSQADALRDAAFQMAQRAQNSEAGAALGQMAARFSSGTGALATLVRERQDLASEWQAQDARLTAEFSALPAQRNAQKEAALRQRLGAIVGRLDTLDARLAKEFPEYASLASPQPLSISGARSLLAPQEALVFIANRLKQSLVWVITAQEVALGARGARRGGPCPRGVGVALWARCDGLGARGKRELPVVARHFVPSRRPAAVRPCPGPRPLRCVARAVPRDHQGQALADRSVGSAVGPALLGAGHRQAYRAISGGCTPLRGCRMACQESCDRRPSLRHQPGVAAQHAAG